MKLVSVSIKRKMYVKCWTNLFPMSVKIEFRRIIIFIQMKTVPKLLTKHFNKIHGLPYVECRTQIFTITYHRRTRLLITELKLCFDFKNWIKTISRKRWIISNGIKTLSIRINSWMFALDGLKINDQSRNHGITKSTIIATIITTRRSNKIETTNWIIISTARAQAINKFDINNNSVSFGIDLRNLEFGLAIPD